MLKNRERAIGEEVKAIASDRSALVSRWVARALEEKPLPQIIRNLELAFGEPRNERRRDPLDTLINVILSQATSDVNSDRAFASLKRRFPTWEDALRGRAVWCDDSAPLPPMCPRRLNQN